MRWFVLLLSVFSALLCTPLRGFTALVTRVASGDVIYVEYKDDANRVHQLGVRLDGVETPQMPVGIIAAQPLAFEAQTALARVALHQTVDVTLTAQDDRSQYYGIVYTARGLCLNVYIAETGLAVPTPISDDYTRDEIAGAVSQAQSLRLGIWYRTPFETPLEYRERMKISATW